MKEMKYQEFVKEHCQDIVNSITEYEYDIDNLDAIFTYDDIIDDKDGNPTKVVYTKEQVPIPVREILSTPIEEFIKIYPSPSAKEMYENYMSMFEVFSPEETLRKMTLFLKKEEEARNRYRDIDVSDILSW